MAYCVACTMYDGHDQAISGVERLLPCSVD